MARIVGVPMVPSEHRPVVPVVDPREYRARRFYIRREVELVKFGYAEICDGCNAAQLGAEAKAHSEGCRERIRQGMMNDGMGQQRLHEAVQRRARTGGQVSDAPRVEVVLWSWPRRTLQAMLRAAILNGWRPAAGWKTFLCRGCVERRKWVRQMTGHVSQRRFSCNWVWLW